MLGRRSWLGVGGDHGGPTLCGSPGWAGSQVTSPGAARRCGVTPGTPGGSGAALRSPAPAPPWGLGLSLGEGGGAGSPRGRSPAWRGRGCSLGPAQAPRPACPASPGPGSRRAAGPTCPVRSALSSAWCRLCQTSRCSGKAAAMRAIPPPCPRAAPAAASPAPGACERGEPLGPVPPLRRLQPLPPSPARRAAGGGQRLPRRGACPGIAAAAGGGAGRGCGAARWVLLPPARSRLLNSAPLLTRARPRRAAPPAGRERLVS